MVCVTVPIGTTCFAAQMLKKCGVRKDAYPFDWIYTAQYIVEDTFSDRFVRFLDPSRHISGPPDQEPQRSGHLDYNSGNPDGARNFFNHKNVLWPEDLAYYQRTVDRMNELLDSGKHIVFFRCYYHIKDVEPILLHSMDNIERYREVVRDSLTNGTTCEFLEFIYTNDLEQTDAVLGDLVTDGDVTQLHASGKYKTNGLTLVKSEGLYEKVLTIVSDFIASNEHIERPIENPEPVARVEGCIDHITEESVANMTALTAAKAVSSGLSIAWWMILLFVVLYLVFNIIGTMYYTKLEHYTGNGWLLASVIGGWIAFPPLNLASPILYATSR